MNFHTFIFPRESETVKVPAILYTLYILYTTSKLLGRFTGQNLSNTGQAANVPTWTFAGLFSLFYSESCVLPVSPISVEPLFPYTASNYRKPAYGVSRRIFFSLFSHSVRRFIVIRALKKPQVKKYHPGP
jgi:hypothetical protein